MPTFIPIEAAYLTTVGGKVYFEGYDQNDTESLWETDGTALGTSEIGGLGDLEVANVYSRNVLLGLNPSHLVAFNGELMFSGQDSSAENGDLERMGI
jgi:hypothetical protein